MDRKVRGCLQTHQSLIERIGYKDQLEGHRGCVNCLEWNSDGTLLASGSDDLDIFVWSIYNRSNAACMHSGHTGNIFSVKFLPFTGDHFIVSGAEDREVRLHDLTTFQTSQIWSCCRGRVKRLAVSPQSPYLIWSASEDGCIRQYDTREIHTCSPEGRCRNVLIDLKRTCGAGPNYTQCKCLSINPVRTEQFAVGALDPYVRLYDNRILSLSYPSNELSSSPDPSCVAHFAPGHISQSYRKHTRSMPNTIASTYVTFSPGGDELLVNLSGEHVYLYNTVNLQPVLTYIMDEGTPILLHEPSSVLTHSTNSLWKRKLMENESKELNEETVSVQVRKLRDDGNALYRANYYTEAIAKYSSAIIICPLWHVLYSNRATSYLKRNWFGDVYAALKDTERALKLCPLHQKSHQRRIKCLKLLGWIKEGLWFLNMYSKMFSDDKEFIKNTTTELNKLDMESSLNGFHSNRQSISSWEQTHQQSACDYNERYIGHCNTHTDIKETCFIGQRGDYIAAGSDDGNVFIWEKESGNLVKILQADESIVNCIQWHPETCILATSGIESVIKLWEPCSTADPRTVDDIYKVCKSNQTRMRMDPFEIMLMRMGLRMGQPIPEGNMIIQDEEVIIQSESSRCRQS